LWLGVNMVFPDIGHSPPPNTDLPERVSEIYLEAASISAKSPRGAAALLRLAIQHLCEELGAGGSDINAHIADLVKKGLPETLQQAFDIVRVTGNNAVHPGVIDVDDAKVVRELFVLINIIAEYMISMPNKTKSIYGDLPENALNQIKKRDESA